MARKKREAPTYEGDEVRLSIMIGGEAGTGIVSAGEILARAFAKCSLHVSAYSEVPSLIRGGHNTFQICVSTHKIHSMWEAVDFLIALDSTTVDLNATKMDEGGVVVYDSDVFELNADQIRDGVTVLPLPLSSMADEHGGTIMRNTVALGVAIALARYECEHLCQELEMWFASKGKKVVGANLKAARAGYDRVLERHPKVLVKGLEGQKCGLPHITITGNQAIVLGALRAGMTFYAGYPMTPASPLLHWLVQLDDEFGIVVKQTEDEISAIGMAIGASAAGARAMTGTSGGGFCLMTESLGLAGEAEVPLVIMLGQRPGPSTGLATRTEQADLLFAIHASQGEFPRAVFTPGDINECFRLTYEAFNIADRYQMPVIVMGDRILNEGVHCTTELDMQGLHIDRGKLLSEKEAQDSLEDGHFKRYAITPDGVSPRAIYGYKEVITTYNGNEHNEFGDTFEGRNNRRAMMDKRMSKLDALVKEMPGPVLYGPDKAEVTLVGWGSVKMQAREAINMLQKRALPPVNYLHFPSVWPMDRKVVESRLRACKRLVGVESNYSGQLCELLESVAVVPIEDRILRYDGRPMTPNFIIRGLRGVMGW